MSAKNNALYTWYRTCTHLELHVHVQSNLPMCHDVVTSIKQSHVLRDCFFIVLSYM